MINKEKKELPPGCQSTEEEENAAQLQFVSFTAFVERAVNVSFREVYREQKAKGSNQGEVSRATQVILTKVRRQ